MTALELVKSRFARRELLYLVIHDEEAKRILAAWMAYGYSCKDFPVKGTELAHILLAKLWASSGEINYDILGHLANVPASRCASTGSRLRAIGLMWPDGTIDEQAARLLRSESISYVQGLLPKGARPPNEHPRDNTSRAGLHQPPPEGVPSGPSSEPGANTPRPPSHRSAAHKAGRRHL